MSRLLQRLFGRLPIGWLQLTHNRTRFAAALAGVAFANVLVFVQLGIMNSMGAATLRPYDFLSDTYGGWENNDGAYGEFCFDAAARTIHLEFNERFTSSELYTHDF